MAGKRRVQAPKQRSQASPADSGRKRQLAAALGGLFAVLVLVVVLLGVMGGGGGGVDEAALRADLEAAGCTLEAKAPAKPSGPTYHTVRDLEGSSPDWNTDPPAAGAHYDIAAIFGIYEEELQLAQVIHSLEHGGIYIFYGDKVPDATVDELRAFYDDHKAGTIMAPLDRLGDEFALGAWVDEGDIEKGFLAKCSGFDEGVVSSFFDSLQFRGPERFDPSQLRPGH